MRVRLAQSEPPRIDCQSAGAVDCRRPSGLNEFARGQIGKTVVCWRPIHANKQRAKNLSKHEDDSGGFGTKVRADFGAPLTTGLLRKPRGLSH